MDFASLDHLTPDANEDDEPVTVNTRALIDGVLARYPGEWTTLRELIQNASDAEATTVKIGWDTQLPTRGPQRNTDSSTLGDSEALKHIVSNRTLRCLRVENDGQPFTPTDWRRLKHIAEGNPDETKIGAFGVGFYSVFAECEEPIVVSGNHAMQFYWKNNMLFTRKRQLSPEASQRGTALILGYRNTTTAVPNLLSIGQFLASCLLTTTTLLQIELSVDGYRVLSLRKESLAVVHTPKSRDQEKEHKEGFMEISSITRTDLQIDATAMSIVGWNPRQSTFAVEEDLTAISTSSIRLQQTSGSVLTSPLQPLADELKRATKKRPPKMTKLAVLTSLPPNDTAPAGSATISNSAQLWAADIFSSVLPSNEPGGRLFIGFPTMQTTGAGVHISAPSVIPTVEREAIDLNAHSIRSWNIQMLQVAGTMTWMAFAHAMSDLEDSKNKGHSQSPRGTSQRPGAHADCDPEALHILKTYTFTNSTPNDRVAKIIEEAFWSAYKRSNTKLVYSSQGVLPTSEVRIGSDELSKFVGGIPVIPPSMRDEPFIKKLRSLGFIGHISFDDIRRELEANVLGTVEQIQAFMTWAGECALSGYLNRSDTQTLLHAAAVVFGESDGNCAAIALRDIKHYVPPDPTILQSLPIPPSCIPSALTTTVSSSHLEALGWRPLEITQWLQFLIDVPDDSDSLTRSPKVAGSVLDVLSQVWGRLGSDQQHSIVSSLQNVASIMTTHGMRKPTESYFPSVTLFKDLPTVEWVDLDHDATSCVLSALGVRKTVELETIFTRLFSPLPLADGEQERWSHMELIAYLASVKDDIPAADIQKLKGAALFPPEADPAGSEPTKGSSTLFTLSKLFEPNSRLRTLGLPLLDWQSSKPYSTDSVEASFLSSLGLRRYPSVNELVDMMAGPDPILRSRAMVYFFDYHQLNGYPSLDQLSTSKAILPIEGKDEILVSPSECCTNEAGAMFGYNVLRKDLHQHAYKLGVCRDPPMSACVDRLISSQRPASREAAVAVFEYLENRRTELRKEDFSKLGGAPIVPVAVQKQPIHAQASSGSEVHPVRYICPRGSYLTSVGRPSEYAVIFDFVDFGPKANWFLSRCGAKEKPSAADIAGLVCEEPERLLHTLQSAKRYLDLIVRPLARDEKILTNHILAYRMRSSRFLLGWREEPSPQAETETGNAPEGNRSSFRRYMLAVPQDIVVLDDRTTYSVFKDSLIWCPDEDLLEHFYEALGSKTLSSLVSEEVEAGPRARDQDARDSWRNLILERSKIFLYEMKVRGTRTRHDARWLGENLRVEIAQRLRLHRSLRGRNQHHTEDRAAAIVDAKGGHILYITAEERRDRIYQVGKALCDLLLFRPDRQAYSHFEFVLKSSLSELEDRGYFVDRALRVEEPNGNVSVEERQDVSEEGDGKRTPTFHGLLTIRVAFPTILAIAGTMYLMHSAARSWVPSVAKIAPLAPLEDRPLIILGGQTMQRYLFPTHAITKKVPPQQDNSATNGPPSRYPSIGLVVALLIPALICIGSIPVLLHKKSEVTDPKPDKESTTSLNNSTEREILSKIQEAEDFIASRRPPESVSPANLGSGDIPASESKVVTAWEAEAERPSGSTDTHKRIQTNNSEQSGHASSVTDILCDLKREDMASSSNVPVNQPAPSLDFTFQTSPPIPSSRSPSQNAILNGVFHSVQLAKETRRRSVEEIRSDPEDWVSTSESDSETNTSTSAPSAVSPRKGGTEGTTNNRSEEQPHAPTEVSKKVAVMDHDSDLTHVQPKFSTNVVTAVENVIDTGLSQIPFIQVSESSEADNLDELLKVPGDPIARSKIGSPSSRASWSPPASPSRSRSSSPSVISESPSTDASTQAASTSYIEPRDLSEPFIPPQRAPSRTGRGQGFMNMDRGWMTVPPSRTIFYGDHSDETRYFGELYVSRYLETFLGKDEYQPENHWTSALRSGSGITRYTAKKSDTSTFTIENTRGKLRDAIVGCKHIPSGALKESVTVHIEVSSTGGELDSTFVLPVAQHDKLKEMHLRDKKDADAVYILARVYRVRDSPGIAMFADPWQLEQDGHITLETVAGYTSCVSKSAPTLLEETFTMANRTTEGIEIYNGDGSLGVGKIRLLTLQDADNDHAPLSGSLKIVNVDDVELEGGFWALSYCWGPPPQEPEPSKFKTQRGEIAITESLASCLRCLRHKRVGARIWADALCINQQDELEKKFQVRQMGSLYAKAARVIVWLGTARGAADDRSSEIDFLADLHSPLCSPDGRCHDGRASPVANPAAPARGDKRWGGVNKFLKRSWFTRAWIVQELALGRDVCIMSGRSEMRWECFMESLLQCSRHLNRGRPGAAAAAVKSLGVPQHDAEDVFLEGSAAAVALHNTRLIYQNGKRKFTLLRLLEMFSYTEASWPRDKIFSLLDLAVDEFLEDFHFDPDYSSTDEAVMESYARGFIKKKPSLALDLLYHAGEAKSASFCSWIPDFMCLRSTQLHPHLLGTAAAEQRAYPPTISTWRTRGGGGNFFAGRSGQPLVEVRGNASLRAKDPGPTSADHQPPPILVIRGYLVDEVRDCHELGLDRFGRGISFPKALRNMLDYVASLKAYPATVGDDDKDDDAGSLGAGRKWRDKLLLRLLVGDARGPQMGPSLESAALLAAVADEDEGAVEGDDPAETAGLFSPLWPPQTGAEVLSLDLSQDAHGYRERPPEVQARMMQYWQTAWTFARRIPAATFCLTRAGGTDKPYAGIVPGATKPGDRIFIANGGKVPFVLREVPGTPHYQLIGECYIHGIMYGASAGVYTEKDTEVTII